MNPEKQFQIKPKCPNPIQKPLAKLKKNKILLQSILLIIKNRIAGIISHNYENNKIIRIAYEKVLSQPQCEDKKDVLQIWMDVQLFFWNLNASPKSWVMMLESEQFYSDQKQIVDMHLFTAKIYEKVLQQAKILTPYAELINNLISGEIFMFLEQISIQICECYKRGRQIVLSQTKKLQQLIKGSSIINFYFIYKLLLEITNICSEKIMENLINGIFSTTEINYCQSFINFIFQKYEIVSLIFDDQSHKKEIDQPLLDLVQRINNNNFKWRQAIRQDGQTGIIVEFENQIDKGQKPENFMIKMDKQGKIIVFNCNILKMKWMATQPIQKNSQIFKVVNDKERLKNKLKNTLFQVKNIKLTQYVITGNALGKCLADIKKFDSVGDFAFQISKKSLVNGSFNYIVSNIPLVGTLVITGGYTMTLYNIFNNKVVNKKKKFQQAGFRTFDIASLLGTGLLGFVVGQTLIPIPLVGAIVGGFVGGFIGDKGGKAITSKLQSLRFKQIVQKLELQIQPEGYWQVNASILQILSLNSQQFYNTIPQQIEQKLGSDKIWFAMIGFTVFSFNESKKRLTFLKQKMQILQQHQKKNENQQIDFELLQKDTHYEPSINLIMIMKYFQKNKIDLICCFKELENFVNTILSIIE